MNNFDKYYFLGFDSEKHSFGNLRFRKKIFKNGRFLPYINEELIVIYSLEDEGLYIFNKDLHLIDRLKSEGPYLLSPITVFNKELVLKQKPGKLQIKFNTETKEFFYPKIDIITGMNFNYSQYQILGGGFVKKQCCYDLEKDTILWQQDLPEKLGQHVSDGKILITECFDRKFKICRELKTGKLIWRIEESDYSEIETGDTLGRSYLVNNSLVGHTTVPRSNWNDKYAPGKWKWFGINIENQKMTWITESEYPLLHGFYADNCYYCIYYHPSTKNYHYMKMSMESGQILEDYSIHDQILDIHKSERITVFKKQITLGALVCSNDYMYFGLGTILCGLNKNTQKVEVMHHGESSYYQGRIAHNKLFMTMTDMSMYIFEGVDPPIST